MESRFGLAMVISAMVGCGAVLAPHVEQADSGNEVFNGDAGVPSQNMNQQTSSADAATCGEPGQACCLDSEGFYTCKDSNPCSMGANDLTCAGCGRPGLPECGISPCMPSDMRLDQPSQVIDPYTYRADNQNFPGGASTNRYCFAIRQLDTSRLRVMEVTDYLCSAVSVTVTPPIDSKLAKQERSTTGSLTESVQAPPQGEYLVEVKGDPNAPSTCQYDYRVEWILQ